MKTRHRALALLLLLALALALVACPAQEPPKPPTCKVYLCYDRDYDEQPGEPDYVLEVEKGKPTGAWPLQPTAAYEHEGWYLVNADGTVGRKWDFSTPVTEDITLVANWRIRVYTVSYYVGNYDRASTDVAYGDYAFDPYLDSPEMWEQLEEWKSEIDAGRVFIGWSHNGELWDFDTDTVVGHTALRATFGDPE